MKTKKILIVEDNQFYGHLLKTKLERITDAEVLLMENGEEVINITHIHPELVFLDYNLETMNGIDVLKEIKSTYPDIHIVMLSGQEKMKVAIEALKYGATDYLIKGVDDSDEALSRIIKDCERISLEGTKKKGFKNRLSILF